MAKYEVLADSVIGHGLVKAGSVIEYDGKSEGAPGANLRLLKPAAKLDKSIAPALERAGEQAQLSGAGSATAPGVALAPASRQSHAGSEAVGHG